ncbi:addiction module toxin, HicA family [Candidatus Parcubacteria bacterium]|nr:MAG: addiction module toxin, HicA family [Candidatus Parcubacteria bacterium]
MTRLPILSGREIIKALLKIGYMEVRQRGSHIRLVCNNKRPITVPNGFVE